jgi:hypothetical protein
MILDDILSNYAQRLVAGQGRDMMAAEGMRYNKGGYYRDVYDDMNEPEPYFNDFDYDKRMRTASGGVRRKKKFGAEEELRDPKLTSSTFAFNKPLQNKRPDVKIPGIGVEEYIPLTPAQQKMPSSRGGAAGYSSAPDGAGSTGDGTRGGGFYYEDESFNSYLTDIYNMNANADMVMERGGKYTYVDGGKF